MATITKRICVPVGQYFKNGSEKPTIEYRDIGNVIEFEDSKGNKWEELRLHVDVLNPVLATLARTMMDKYSSSARVKLFDVTRKSKAPSNGEEEEQPPKDDDIPF